MHRGMSRPGVQGFCPELFEQCRVSWVDAVRKCRRIRWTIRLPENACDQSDQRKKCWASGSYRYIRLVWQSYREPVLESGEWLIMRWVLIPYRARNKKQCLLPLNCPIFLPSRPMFLSNFHVGKDPLLNDDNHDDSLMVSRICCGCRTDSDRDVLLLSFHPISSNIVLIVIP